ncbi:MAG: hypothetical protein C0605_16395 [Hyphomicrobiales bacterium]|nr:MAG: hypothetical protein C0605_16395 [Hyphomicrobiales bacterium]
MPGNPGAEREPFAAGSALAGNPDTYTPHDGAEGSAPEMASFFGGLSEDNRRIAETKGWDDPNKIIQSYGELESHLGRTLNVPDEGASAEDWDRLYARLGRPDSAEDYDFGLPENLPEDFPYDGESARAFASWAHEAGLNPAQAQTLHDHYVRHQAQTLDDFHAGNARREGEAYRALTQAWGPEGSEAFARNAAMANAAMRDAGEAREAMISAGLMAEDGGVRDARLALWFAKLGERFFSEDTLDGGGAGDWSDNPFAEQTLNATRQAQLIKSDPDTAISYMRAAGLANSDPQMRQARQNRR